MWSAYGSAASCAGSCNNPPLLRNLVQTCTDAAVRGSPARSTPFACALHFLPSHHTGCDFICTEVGAVNETDASVWVRPEVRVAHLKALDAYGCTTPQAAVQTAFEVGRAGRGTAGHGRAAACGMVGLAQACCPCSKCDEALLHTRDSPPPTLCVCHTRKYVPRMSIACVPAGAAHLPAVSRGLKRAGSVPGGQL